MRSVVVSWMEVSAHSVTVNVPADFDPGSVDVGDVLGALADDGFFGVVREGFEVRDLDVVEPGAEVLFPG